MSLWDQIKIIIRENKIIQTQVKVYIAGLAHIKGPTVQRSVAGGNASALGASFFFGGGAAPPEHFENLSL